MLWWQSRLLGLVLTWCAMFVRLAWVHWLVIPKLMDWMAWPWVHLLVDSLERAWAFFGPSLGIAGSLVWSCCALLRGNLDRHVPVHASFVGNLSLWYDCDAVVSFHVGGLLAAEGETCFALAGVGRWVVVDLLPKLEAELPKELVLYQSEFGMRY